MCIIISTNIVGTWYFVPQPMYDIEYRELFLGRMEELILDHSINEEKSYASLNELRYYAFSEKNMYRFLSTFMFDCMPDMNFYLPLSCLEIFEYDGLVLKISSEYQLHQRLLQLSGDVELNPGPTVLSKYNNNLIRYANMRQKQDERRKTVLLRQRNLKRDLKLGSFVPQMRDLFTSLKPETRCMTYGVMNTLVPGAGTALGTTIEMPPLITKLNDIGDNVQKVAQSVKAHLPSLFHSTETLTEIAQSALLNINTTIGRLNSDNGILSRLEQTLGGVQTIVSTKTLLITLMVVMSALLFDWKITCGVIMVVLLLNNWPTQLIDKVREILFGLKFQSFDTDPSVRIIGQVVFTLLCFFGVSCIPTGKFYESLLKRMDSVPKAVTGAGKIWEGAGKMFEYCVDEFKVYFLHVKRSDLHFESQTVKEINAWVERVHAFTQVENRNSIAKDREVVEQVMELYRQYEAWKHTPAIWRSLPTECQMVLNSMNLEMRELMKLVGRSTVFEGGPRKAPFAIFISGAPGIGKSEILDPIAQYMMAVRKLNVQNIRNEVYVRNYETEYWDGYVGQKIVYFDDAFQMKDSPSNPSPEFMETIRLLNTAPAHVHCADINDKGRFFTSEICIFTSNIDRNLKSFIKSVNCPEATIRRLNACAYRMFVRDEYARAVKVDHKVVKRMDKDKVKNCTKCVSLRQEDPRMYFCPHANYFERYDMYTDEVKESNISFPKLLKQLAAYDVEFDGSEERKLNSMQLLLEKPDFYSRLELEMDDHYEEPLNYNKDGVVDLSNVTDAENYVDMMGYLAWLNEENLLFDDILANLSRYPNMYSIYSRREKCGITAFAQLGQDLSCIIQDEQKMIERVRHKYSYSRKTATIVNSVLERFQKYVSEISNDVVEWFKNCPLMDYMGIFLIVFPLVITAGTLYMSYNKCSDCSVSPCQCIKLTTQGYKFQGQYYAYLSNTEDGYLLSNERDFQTEAAESSAPLPPRTRSLRVEVADSSGPPPPKTRAYRVEAASSSGPPPPKTKNYRVEANEELNENSLLVPEVYGDNGCRDIENAVINKSLYLLHTKTKILGNAIMLRGSTFLVNYHYIAYFKALMKRSDLLYLSNLRGCMATFTVGDVLDNHIRLSRSGHEVDATIVHLNPKYCKVAIHPDITSYFITTEDLSLLGGKYAAQMPTYGDAKVDGVMCPSKRSLIDVEYSTIQEKIDSSYYSGRIAQYFQYIGSTISGDCGSPIIINNASAARKILGIHTASRVVKVGSQGVAQIVTQEMLLTVLNSVPLIAQAYVEIDIPLHEIPMEKEKEGSVPLREGLMIHGTTTLSTTSGGKTKIEPSDLYGVLETKTMPAILRANEYCDPMYNGLKKFGKEVPRIDPKIIDIAVTDVKNNFYINPARLKPEDYRRVLTYEEAVLGNDDEFIAPINRGTSMGYPYVAQYHDLRGKRCAFGNDEWTLDSPMAKKIQEDVEQLLKYCKQGVQKGVYWSDTLKDERRPIEKVMAGKTRVFCGGPVHFTILFRQYFLGFAAWIMHNRIHNEIATGTNVYSRDWDAIVHKLQSRGLTKEGITKVIAGDFSNFDGSLSSQILWYILDAINSWYDDGPENQLIRQTLWMHIVNAVHINGNVIYQTTHSQPSGCPITAILNSVYNSIIIRIVYLLCAEKYKDETGDPFFYSMEQFNQLVSCVSYGDDNLIAINEGILEWFNQITITEAFKIIGHEYTDEAKSGIIIPVRTLEEVQFLKRSFKYDEILNQWIAPLSLDTVLEIFQWTKKGLARDSITLANIDVTMRELALYDLNTFERYREILQRACAEKGIFYRFLTYLEYRGSVLSSQLLMEGARQKYKLEYARKEQKGNPNYIVKSQKKLLISRNCDENILIPKLALFVRYRHLEVTTDDGNLQHIIDKMNAL